MIRSNSSWKTAKHSSRRRGGQFLQQPVQQVKQLGVRVILMQDDAGHLGGILRQHQRAVCPPQIQVPVEKLPFGQGRQILGAGSVMTAWPISSRSTPPSKRLSPALVRRWAPLAITRKSPVCCPNSARIWLDSLYSYRRRQMHWSERRGIERDYTVSEPRMEQREL